MEIKTQVLALANERKAVRFETEVDFCNMKLKGKSPENEVVLNSTASLTALGELSLNLTIIHLLRGLLN